MFQPVRRQQDTNSSLSLVPSTSDPVASSSPPPVSLSTPALPPSDTTAPSSSGVQPTASSSTVYEPPATSSSEPISTSSIAPSSTSAPSSNPSPPPSSSDPIAPSSTPYTPPYTPPASSSPYTPPYTPPVTPTDTLPYSPPPSSPPFTPSSSATPNPSSYSPWSYVPQIMSSDTLSISVSTSVQPPSSSSSPLSSSTPAPTGPSSTLTTMSTPQPPPSSSSSTGPSSSSSSGGDGGLDTVTSTSSSGPSSSSSNPGGSSSSSTPGSSSSPSSSSTPTSSSSSSGGGLDTVTTTSSASPSSSPSDTGGSSPSSSSSTRTSTRSDDDPPAPSSSPDSPPQNDSATSTRTPTTTFSTPVSLTMTNSQGSVFVTSPSEITTVVVTTVPNGSFTTLTEIIANPPGVLNSGDRSPASTFFKNRGAVAGVFVTAALALCAMILFVVFALRRRRQRLQRERDAEIAAGLAAAALSQRFTDDGDHPVVMRSVPSSRLAMRRSPLPDDEDDDERIAYSATGAPIMYSNPHMMPMAITRDTAYPISPARYGALGAAAANRSRTPSPSKDPFANPIATIIEPASPVANANSGWPSHGALYAGQRSQSVSPVPTTSAPASAHHGTNFGAATSTGHAPSSYHTVPPYRPPTASSGKDGSSGSGGSTSVPGTIQPPVPMTMTTTSRSNLDRSSSPALSSVYPPEYEQFASVENGSGNDDVGYAYEPSPVQHSRQITAGMLPVPGFDSPRQSNDYDAYSGIRSPLSGSGGAGAVDLGRTASVGSRSMYSQDASAEWDEHDRMPREDPRLDPLMRMHGGLVSAASMGQTDHLDYMRRVQPQALNSPSTVSHSQSTH